MSRTVRAFRPDLIHQRLSTRMDRDTALQHVETLYKLLPGGSKTFKSFSELPKKTVGAVTADATRQEFLLNCFLKKFKGFKLPTNPKENAMAKFLSYEDRCKNSNQKIRLLRQGSDDSLLQTAISVAQRKIAFVLGRFDFEELLSSSKWGPGVTSSCKGSCTGGPSKFASRPDVTSEFLKESRLLMPLFPSWVALLVDQDYGVIANPMPSVKKGNRITFVPKTAEIDRVIAVEPHLNVFFQGGLGVMIRRRLKQRASVDLNDQTLNQQLARIGSVSDSLATIDLEGASDTVCRELVRELLPEDWFYWLDITRSHYGELPDGTVLRYQKFSSMGNGATFDLESLIFWALSVAVTEIQGYNTFWVNTFGDDIIVPSGCYDEVVHVLEGVGFLVNQSKSFSNGPFRESCGKDWFDGFPVRPVYLKDIPDTIVSWLILANQIRALSHLWCDGYGCDIRLKKAYDYCVSRIPKDLRYQVPKGYELKKRRIGGFEGNGLLANLDEAVPSRAGYGWDLWKFKGIVTSTVTTPNNDRRLLTSGVHQLSQTGNDLPLKDQVLYREARAYLYTREWYDMGPWV